MSPSTEASGSAGADALVGGGPATGARLRDLVLFALAHFTGAGRGESDASAEVRHLRERADGLALEPERWESAFRSAILDPAPCDRPLVEMGARFGLSASEIFAAELARLVEEDLMTGRAVAYLQAPLGGSRPLVGLVTRVVSAASGFVVRPAALVEGPAKRVGLLQVSSGGGPLPEMSLSVPTHVCAALEGRDGVPAGVRMPGRDQARVRLPGSFIVEARRRSAAMGGAPARALVVRCGSRMEAETIAAAVAEGVGLGLAFIDEAPEGLAPWLSLRGRLPVYSPELEPGRVSKLAPPSGYDGPIVVLAGRDGSVDIVGYSVMEWSVPVPDVAERHQLWKKELGRVKLARELSVHHRHGAGRIAHLARLASFEADLDGRRRPGSQDLLSASWSLEGGSLGELAQPIRAQVTDGLITNARLRDDLAALVRRCRARDELARDLGAAALARFTPGVRSLFVGPAGTGKTLGAAWLATELGLPLYRVDLAAVTSKYVGETEKNLAALLSRAERAEVILLFDEADSLFGKRTEIRDANDRFANAQTNYLLQRIETFEGIVLLTSNSRARFDSAFARRLDLVIEFPMPGPEERRLIWKAHLGEGHALSPAELNRLAGRVDLAGGHVRNAVLSAAADTRANGGRIGFEHILRGLEREYRKLGRPLPSELRSGP